MLGSVDDAEDLVQDTLLRAWRGRHGFEGRSRFRTWLYRIATNACLTALERAPRRVLPQDVTPPITAATDASGARETPAWAPEIPWLQPYPDHLLDIAAPSDGEPEALLASRETIELVFLAALQHLPPRQRAILISCDVLGWSAREVAEALELSVASVTSALQRAHATMRAVRPAASIPGDPPPVRASAAPAAPTDDERALLAAYMDAWGRADVAALTRLLHDDARWAMPPAPLWFDGRAAIVRLLTLFPMDFHGAFRFVPTAANRQVAAAAYLRPHGQTEFRLSGVHVLRIAGGAIAEITTFSGALCSRFGLAPTL
jgi:RNA polymerase sigma-70 factor (ECF subfamily)